MQTSYNRLSQYLSLAAMILLTVIAIYTKQISVFYILYLFWWDEFIKTISDRLRYQFHRNQLGDPIDFLSHVKSRSFMLMIYLVFIIVFFGLMLNWRDENLILHNFEVFFFRNILFDMSLLSFILREIYLFRNHISGRPSYHLFSKGIITLHLSLILGIIFWFLVKEKVIFFKDYATIIAIIPFLLLKIFFEVSEINNKSR